MAVFLLSFISVNDSPPENEEVIENRLGTFLDQYTPQKVYLHLDKSSYSPGERIWFRAYLLDALHHIPDTAEQNLIVEVINSFGQRVMTRLLLSDDGTAHGDFPVADTLPQGLYTVRAYTDWMRNFGSQYFMSREINIWNPGYSSEVRAETKSAGKRLRKKSRRKSKKIDVQFLPEGGNMLAGFTNRIAFKAINELGLGIDIRGQVTDRKGRMVAEFESDHLGMGSFRFKPAGNMKYKAVVTTPDGKERKLTFPEAQDHGILLTVDVLDDDDIAITAKGNPAGQKLYLVMHTRGTSIFNRAFRIENNSASFRIPKSRFPTGILHITIFNGQLSPLAERLVFIDHQDYNRVIAQTSKEDYRPLEKVNLSLRVRDPEGNPASTALSLSVAKHEGKSTGDFNGGIRGNLLLTSDLKGGIQDPGYYFEDHSPQRQKHLDDLLMTQGWRRFTWEQVLFERKTDIEYEKVDEITVSGRVTRQFFDLPLKNIPVTMTIKSGFNDVFRTTSDDKGRFAFGISGYHDTLQVEITARQPNGKRNLLIHLDKTALPETQRLYSSYSRDMVIKGRGKYTGPVPGEESGEPGKPDLHRLYRQPDAVIIVDERFSNYHSVFEILKGRVPGVQVNGDNVVIRGPSSIMLSNEPLYLIDNVPVDKSAVSSLNPMDIDRIEILKGPGAAIYGSRGANGVISIYTRRGRFAERGVLEFLMLAYHRPHEFYSPRYGTVYDELIPDNRNTLYWDPDIEIRENGMTDVVFYTSSSTGRFLVVAEGISAKGKIATGETDFLVEKAQ